MVNHVTIGEVHSYHLREVTLSIWIILWLGLSATLIYFLFWTLFILYKQKRAWQAYGKRRKLRYDSESLLSPPTLTGPFDDYTVSLFTGEHLSSDMRGTRKLMAVEIKLHSTMPLAGGVASGDLRNVITEWNLKDEVKPENPEWKDEYVAVCENGNVLETYLTPARIDALVALMKIKNAWVIAAFRGDTFLLRFDTPDPVASEKKLEVLLKKMVATAKVLEFEPGELERFKVEEAKKPKRQASIDLKDDDLDVGGLQLEDDEEEAVDDVQPEPKSDES